MRLTPTLPVVVAFAAGVAAAFTLVALAESDDFDRSADQTIWTFTEQEAG